MKNDSYRKTIVFGIIVLLVGMGFMPSIIGNKDVVNVGYNRIGTAHMGIIPSSDTVNIGEDFIATIYIDPSEAVGGWEIYLLIFTQGIVNATEVSPGPEWTDFFDDGFIHNDAGNITEIQAWKTQNYPDYNHTACIINFTAFDTGVCSIELVSVQISDSAFNDMDVIVHNATILIISNQPPYSPSDPDPEDGETDIGIDDDISWTGGDPDGDPVTYDVYFGTTSLPPLVEHNQTETSYDPGTMTYEIQYFWQIVSWDDHGASTPGPIWDFTTEEEPEPDLDCDGSLSWTEVEPGATVTGSFTVENIGDAGSELDWEIDDNPPWGTWTFTPDSGDNLTPEDGPVTVEVEVVAPDESETEFTGEVKIVNTEDPSDYCIIDASLATPVNQDSISSYNSFYHYFIDKMILRFIV